MKNLEFLEDNIRNLSDSIPPIIEETGGEEKEVD